MASEPRAAVVTEAEHSEEEERAPRAQAGTQVGEIERASHHYLPLQARMGPDPTLISRKEVEALYDTLQGVCSMHAGAPRVRNSMHRNTITCTSLTHCMSVCLLSDS
jgi:hypothetical protein